MRGDGDNHMRGIGCLLTGVELFPATSRAAPTRRPAGPSGISIDQEIKNHLQQDPATRTRFGSLEFGVHGAQPGRHLDADGLRRREQADRADQQSLSDVQPALRQA